MSELINRYRLWRLLLFRWRTHASLPVKLFLSLSFACLTGLMANISCHLPWTPVPLTGQTYAVLLAGIMLGRWGALSQVLYIILGLTAIPWFSGGAVIAFTGATAGYLAGFVVAAGIVGTLVDNSPRSRRGVRLMGMLMIVNFAVVHGLGLAWLYVWNRAVLQSSPSIYTLMVMGSAPFIPGDIIKVLLAAATGRFLIPEIPCKANN